MTAAKFCGVFDEIFLVNFCLPITSFNVVDMTNVDKILDSTSYAGSLILKEEDLTSEMLDNRPGDLSENPETARQDGMDDEDLLQICSQRRWSTFCLNTKINSADLGVPKLNELSPIMKELDDTFFGNDRLCDLFTTFDTINSPLWLEVGNRRNDDTKIDSEVEDLVMNIDQMNSPVLERNRGIRICGESDNCKPLPLPTYDHDFPELNQFDQLSISDCPARKSNHVIKAGLCCIPSLSIRSYESYILLDVVNMCHDQNALCSCESFSTEYYKYCVTTSYTSDFLYLHYK